MKIIDNKPLSPANHGLGDYAFALAMLGVPALLGAPKKTIKLYAVLALEVLAYSALTKYKYALKPIISLDAHRKIDLVNLAGMALLQQHKLIKRDKKVMAFNLALLGVGLLNVCFTDWKQKA